MTSGSDWSFLSPLSAVRPVVVSYLVPLLAAAIWSTVSAYRAFGESSDWRPSDRQIWWSLPILLWAFAATIRNIQAFDVLVENYSRALVISLFMAVNEALVSLCLVFLIQLPGLLAHVRWPSSAAAPSWSLGAVSAVAAVLLGYLLSVSVVLGPLLESATQAQNAL